MGESLFRINYFYHFWFLWLKLNNFRSISTYIWTLDNRRNMVLLGIFNNCWKALLSCVNCAELHRRLYDIFVDILESPIPGLVGHFGTMEGLPMGLHPSAFLQILLLPSIVIVRLRIRSLSIIRRTSLSEKEWNCRREGQLHGSSPRASRVSRFSANTIVWLDPLGDWLSVRTKLAFLWKKNADELEWKKLISVELNT